MVSSGKVNELLFRGRPVLAALVAALLGLYGVLAVTAGPAMGSAGLAREVVVRPEGGGISVSPTEGLTTTEAGGVATFRVVLTSEPTATVSIGLSSSDTTEGVVATAGLVFSDANWNITQTVTVTGVNDFGDDGNVAYTIVTAAAVSSDPDYSGVNPANVAVVNSDDDTADIVIDPTAGLVTSEAGITDTFTVVLGSQPTANVSFNLNSNNTAEGTVSPGSLTFTAANWNTPRTVTLTGVDEDVDDDDQAYTIVTNAATSGDDDYDGLNPANVTASNQDDDTAGIVVDPTSGLVTEEDGSQDSFTVVLNSEPTANVSFNLTSSDTGEGTVSPGSLTFTAANWDTPRTVTLTGVNDAIDDGDQPYTINTAAATSSDGKYNGLNPDNVAATNLDDDGAGVSIEPVTDLVTTEAGGTDTFTIQLDTQPTDEVTLGLSSSDTGEGTVGPNSVTFDGSNWDTPQTVTITGVDDEEQDGAVGYSIITAAAVSDDPAYNGTNPADVSVTNQDNDAAGFIVTPTVGLITDESGETDSFQVRLTSQPAVATQVVIPLASSDESEGTVSADSLTFTRQNWNVFQQVTVTGVDDALFDGNVAYTIVTGPAESADPAYDGLNPADVQVVNQDRDVRLYLPAVVTVPTPVWEQVGNEPAGVTKFYSVAVCGSHSFAGADNGVYRLVGNSWQQQTANGLPTTVIVYGVAFGTSCNSLFVGTWGQGTWRGDFNGSAWSWQRVDTAGFTDDNQVRAVAVREGTVYVGTEHGIFWAANPASAQVWTGTNVTTLVTGVHLNEDDSIYAAVWNQGVYQAGSGSHTWTEVGNIADSLVYQAAATSNNYRVAGTQNRIYRWSGGSWQAVNQFVSTTFATTAAYGKLYAGQRNNGVLVSEDGGQSWAAMNGEMAMPAGEEFQVRGFFVDGDGFLYAATTSGVWRWSAVIGP